MVITDPLARPRDPRTAEATGRFSPRLPDPSRLPRRPQPHPASPPVLEIPLRPRWLGWR